MNSEAEQVPLSLEVPQLEAPEAIERYAVIVERPVFNESRQPEISAEEEALGEDGEDEQLADEDVEAPEVQLSGVVITPSLRIVTLRPKGKKESLVAFEGQPLEGDYGSWHVSRIGPRDITLSSGRGQEVRLELPIHDARIERPPEPEKPAEPETAAADDEGDDDNEPLSRAEEIRRRIAERREELRREREEDTSEQSSYQTAIQAMVGMQRKSRQKDDDDNDE